MATTGQDIANDCRAEVIEAFPAFFQDTYILNLINLAQREYVLETRVVQSMAFTSTVIGQPDYPLPGDWLALDKVLYNDVGTTTTDSWQTLGATSIEKMGQENPNFLSNNTNNFGIPKMYYVFNQTLFVYPKPKTTGTNDLYMFYQAKPINLTSLASQMSIDDTLVPGIRAYVLWKMWTRAQEPSLAAEQYNLYQTELRKGRMWKNLRELDLRQAVDIDSFTPYGYGGTSTVVPGINNPLGL
jgi:hypothetical protein